MGFGFSVWGLGFGVRGLDLGLGCKCWGMGFDLGIRVEGSGIRD